jgi:hypothetical protein
MSLITDELVWVMCTAFPCYRNASASRAENVLSSYCLCHVVTRAVLHAFGSVVRPGQSGRPARLRGTVTGDALHHVSAGAACLHRHAVSLEHLS